MRSGGRAQRPARAHTPEPPYVRPEPLAWLRDLSPLRRELLITAPLLLLVSIAFYAELVLPSRILADYDVWTYFYPLRAYGAAAIHAGWFPFWNPDTFLGAPFFANPQTALLYPGTLLFYALPVPYAFSLSIILHVFLAGWFFYWFCRLSVGVGRPAAAVGAAAFALGGFFNSQAGHLNQLCATAWMPAVVLAADNALRNRSWRWTAAAGGAFGMQLLAGHAQESYMTLWVLAIALLWRTGLRVMVAVQARWIDTARARAAGLETGQTPLASAREHLQRLVGLVSLPIWIAVGVGGLGFALAAVQLLPTAELSSYSIRSGGLSYQEGIAFSLPPPLLVRALLPGYWFNPPDENVGYIGGIGLGLAVRGLLFSRSPATLLAIIVGVVGLFFAVGGANPLYRFLFDAVPGLNLFRVPARWLVVY